MVMSSPPIAPEVWQAQAQAMLRDAITIGKFEGEVLLSVVGPEIAVTWIIRGVRYVVLVRRMAQAEKLAAEIRAGSLARYGPGEGITAMAANAVRFHHPWPMYLRGKIQQILEPLPKALHDAYHKGLDKFLPRQASDGIDRGKAVYDKMSNAEIREAFQKLEAYTKDFDARNGTHLWEAMLREGFPGSP